MNLGLRYDAEINTLDNSFTVPWTKDYPVLNNSALLQPYLNQGNRKNDLNNLSPRVSFSWDVFDDNRTFLRGGAGIIYDRVTTFTGFGERRDASWRTYNFNNPGTTDPEVLRQRIRNGLATATPAFQLLKNKMETPESHQFSLGIGQQVTQSLGVNLDVIHQRVSHLYVRWNPNALNLTTNQRPRTNRPRSSVRPHPAGEHDELASACNGPGPTRACRTSGRLAGRGLPAVRHTT